MTAKQYADGRHASNAYEATTSRLKSTTDPLGQVKGYSYDLDNALSQITYTHAVNPTATVTFAYDPYFRRTVSMTDGIGTTKYAYVPTGTAAHSKVAESRRIHTR